MIGSDDVLACFIAGNVFTWDDWFRLETKDDSLQPTIDMLLNVGVFMWFGAVCPWHSFVDNSIIPIYRLIPLGILVLLLRRLPMVLAFQKGIHQVEDFRRALFMGYFGPIGVSAIFYLYISKEFLREIVYEGHEREDAARLEEMLDVIVWFLVLCSIVGHGLSVPLGKLGFYLPRTISTALSSERLSFAQSTATAQDASQSDSDQNASRNLTSVFRRRRPADGDNASAHSLGSVAVGFPGPVNATNSEALGSTNAREEGTSSKDSASPTSLNGRARPTISAPSNPRTIGRIVDEAAKRDEQPSTSDPEGTAGAAQRRIRFGDERLAN